MQCSHLKVGLVTEGDSRGVGEEMTAEKSTRGPPSMISFYPKKQVPVHQKQTAEYIHTQRNNNRDSCARHKIFLGEHYPLDHY